MVFREGYNILRNIRKKYGTLRKGYELLRLKKIRKSYTMLRERERETQQLIKCG